jgi:molybdenum storage protein
MHAERVVDRDQPVSGAAPARHRRHRQSDKAFGVRSVILLKDVDGVYTADPKTNPNAAFIAEIGAAELIARQLPTLPIEPVVLELLARTKLVRGIRIVNGLVPGNLTRVLAGEQVGTMIHA